MNKKNYIKLVKTLSNLPFIREDQASDDPDVLYKTVTFKGDTYLVECTEKDDQLIVTGLMIGYHSKESNDAIQRRVVFSNKEIFIAHNLNGPSELVTTLDATGVVLEFFAIDGKAYSKSNFKLEMKKQSLRNKIDSL